MLTVLASAALAPYAYGFAQKSEWNYQVNVTFDGFLPILGGNEGKAEVAMGVKVDGLGADGDNQKASNEMTDFALSFNGSKLPLTLENAQDYFPKTTVTITPQGKIVKNDAPDKQLPVKLPGLDVKRFPDITYLPVELPADGKVESGTKWTFTKSFGGSDIDYTCRVDKVEGDLATISVKVHQIYTVLENEALEVVKDKNDAVAEVTTELDGKGTVIFDSKRGIVTSVDMANQSVSTGKNFEEKMDIYRKLDSTLKVRLVDKKAAPAVSSGGSGGSGGGGFSAQLQSFWSTAVKTGQKMWLSAADWVAMVKIALGLAWKKFPGIGKE